MSVEETGATQMAQIDEQAKRLSILEHKVGMFSQWIVNHMGLESDLEHALQQLQRLSVIH